MMLEQAHNTLTEETFAGTLESYLEDILHTHIRVQTFAGAGNLPAFLEQTYAFYGSQIVGQKCLFIAARENVATPADIAKHVGLVRSATDAVIVFAAPSLSAHNRSRLITQGVAFVVPGNQLYIPELAMDLREHFRAPKSRPTDGLPPAAQAVLFHCLLRLDEYATTPSTIAERLRYSAMSIGRAFDDLVALGLAKTEKHGKERHIQFNANRRPLLESARNLLRSPVRAVKYIRDGHSMPPLKRAGESALAELTNLSLPQMVTYAVAAGDWKAIAATFDFIEVHENEAEFAVETWSYDPAGLSDAPVVDPLSLYAQFRDHRDERVSMAAESLLENLPW